MNSAELHLDKIIILYNTCIHLYKDMSYTGIKQSHCILLVENYTKK